MKKVILKTKVMLNMTNGTSKLGSCYGHKIHLLAGKAIANMTALWGSNYKIVSGRSWDQFSQHTKNLTN